MFSGIFGSKKTEIFDKKKVFLGLLAKIFKNEKLIQKVRKQSLDTCI